MRPFFLLALALPFPALADTFETPSRIDRVTIYPWGASVTRLVEFTADAGVHQLIVPDLPEDTDARSLRVVAPDGVTVGAVNLANGRLPVTADRTSPEVKAAEAEIERLEGALRARDAAIAAIRLKAEAAGEQVAFLRGLGQGKSAEGLSAGAVEELRALSRMVGDEVLSARQVALAAEGEAEAAERAKKDDLEALEKAHQALAALQAEGQDNSVLTLAVQSAGGTSVLEVTTFVSEANWQPIYDLRLTREGTPELQVDRGILVSQYSGEDWTGVDLTLSTARPSEQNTSSGVYPWQRWIVSEAQQDTRTRSADAPMLESMVGAAAPVAAQEAIVADKASIQMMGATATYHYGNRVDIRDGVEDLRLKLDTLTLKPDVRAEAVPLQDSSAYVMAEMTNTAGELILPGQATLYLDGALIGQSELPLIASGDKTKLGFGPIDGIRLIRTVPQRSEGDQGIITKSNRIDEIALLSIENLTGEAWPMRVLDRVPYSEQDDLVINYTATPPVTKADVDGARGVLAWEFDLAPGTKREIQLTHSISWPSGYVLQ